MPIKFHCPHCKKPLSVKEHLAGKKGTCPACHQTLTVPGAPAAPVAPSAPAPPAAPSAPRPPAASKPPAPKAPAAKPSTVRPPAPPRPPATAVTPQAPPPNPADLEAEAAALFSDGPAAPVTEGPQTVDFKCPMCDEPLHLSADLAGKRAPCPECKRIIKVPELTKNQPVDWRKPGASGPAGARKDTAPPPEGAWDQTQATKVNTGALVEAGVLDEKKVPLTRGQKIKRGLILASVAGVLLAGGLIGSRWWGQKKQVQALKVVLDYANSDTARKQVGPEGLAVLHVGAGQYLVGTRDRNCGVEARNQFEGALKLLREAPKRPEREGDRDLALTELALALIDLAGTGEDVRLDLRASWDTTQKMLRAVLKEVSEPEARLEALRRVARRLLAHGQAPRVAALASQVYTGSTEGLPEALAVAGLELFQAGQTAEAERVVVRVLAAFNNPKKQPPLRPAVVALAMALGKKPPPKSGKGVIEGENEFIGHVEGLARQGKLDEARQKARGAPRAEVRFRALVAVASAEPGDAAAGDVEAARQVFEAELRGKSEVAWDAVRLARLGAAGGVAEERLQALAAGIPVRPLRGQAQLAILRGRLESSKQVVGADALDKVEAKTLAHHLAREALAQHNIRHDGGYDSTVQGWEEPARTFGTLGVLLGRQRK